MSDFEDCNENSTDTHGVLTMSVTTNVGNHEYSKTLSFWKTLEDKYRERRRKWMEANARMVSAQILADNAKQEYELVRKETETEVRNELKSSLSKEGFADAVDDEFSDVDADFFVDPGARYYSSLDSDRWQRIKADIMNIHKQAECEFEERRRAFLRRLILSLGIGLVLLVVGLHLMWKVLYQPETSACAFNCDGGQTTLVDEILQVIFPRANLLDEV